MSEEKEPCKTTKVLWRRIEVQNQCSVGFYFGSPPSPLEDQPYRGPALIRARRNQSCDANSLQRSHARGARGMKPGCAQRLSTQELKKNGPLGERSV